MIQTYSRRGGESRANSTLSDDQLSPSIAKLASGGFVVAWADYSIYGTRAQIYDSSGAKVGGEIVVNGFNSAFPPKPGVAGLAGGGFVVSWHNYDDPLDPNSYGVIAQIFDPAGAKVGGEFALPDVTAGGQLYPDLVALGGGGFVATWVGSAGSGIRAHIFSDTGLRIGGEFTVNTTFGGDPFAPSAAAFSNGGFVVTWFDNVNGTSDGWAIRAQRFDSAGAKLGGELLVNSVSTHTERPAVAALAGGGFVITWDDIRLRMDDSLGYEVRDYDVRGQVYDPNGDKVGGEFLVNYAATNRQYHSTVAPLPWGGFIVSWYDFSQRPDDLSGAVRAQIYDATGVPVGAEFLVNTTTDGYQGAPDVAVLNSGAFVIGWTDVRGDADVRVQLFVPSAGPADLSLSRMVVNEAMVQGLTVARISSDAANGSPIYGIVADSTGGAFSVVGDRLVLQDSARLDYESAASVSITLRVTDVNGAYYDEVFALSVADSLLEARYAVSPEFLVNASVVGQQGQVSIIPFAGGFVYGWVDSGFFGVDQGVLKLQLVDLTGVKTGGEISPGGGGAQLVMAPLQSGGFVASWVEWNAPGDGDDFGVRAQLFDSSGAKLGDPLQVNVATSDRQSIPSVAGLPGGGFVVSWTDDGHTTENGSGVRARIYNSVGVPQTGEIKVNSNVEFNQRESSVAALATGGFIITWTDVTGDGSETSLKLQRFDDFGEKVGGEVVVNTATEGSQLRSTISGLPNGGFVVTWIDNGGFESNARIKAQLFDPAGAKVGGEIVVTPSSGEQFSDPQVGALPWGGFAVAWTDRSGVGEDKNATSVRLQIFDGLGEKVGESIQVNDIVLREQMQPSFAVAADGTIALGWTDYSGDGGGFASAGVRGRVLSLPEQLGGGPQADFLVAGYGDSVSGGSGRDLLSIDFAGAPGGVVADFRRQGEAATINVAGATIGGIEMVWYMAGSEFGDYLAPVGSAGSEGIPGVVYGRAGDDEIHLSGFGSLGGIAYGGDGNDRLTGSSGEDSYRGGEGIDTIDFSGEPGPVAVNLQSGSTFGPYFHPGATRLLGPGEALDSFGNYEAVSGVENLILTGGNDHVYGSDGSNRIEAGGGNDQIHGLGGDDVLLGGTGDDSLFGHFGDDTIEGGDGVDQLQGGEGNDSIDAGAGNDFALGGDGNDRVRGGSGDDTLDGGAGDDSLSGGAGNDVYFVDSAADSVTELAGEGVDEVRTALAAYALGAELENLRGLSSAGQALTGNGLDNFIFGGAGADTILGGGGNDRINGGAGADVMRGGTGDDVYAVDNVGDVVEENGGEGTDTVVTLLSTYSLLGTQIENLTAPSSIAYDLRGSTGDNVVTGGGGNDFIRLQDGGNDTAIGGGGNDVFLFGSTLNGLDSVNGGSGTDQVAIQGDYWGGKALTLGSNLVSVENIAILPGNDTRFGDAGTSFYDYSITVLDSAVAAGVLLTVDANRLRAGEDFTFNGSAETDGSFFVYGGGGIDRLIGGAKNDVFIFGGQGQFGSGDFVIGGAGIDQLALRGNYALTFGAGQLVGVEQIGMVSAQDTRYGALGSTYSYDLTMVDANVESFQMTVDASPLRTGETLKFNGSAEDDGSFRVFGGRDNDIVVGSQNADLIQGNGGADTLTGGQGADVFRYFSASDSTGSATDHILDFAAGADKIDLGRIDADTLTAGDQAFSWIGSNAFSGTAGQLRAYQDGASWFVEGDTDGNGSADFVVMLSLDGPTPLGAGDFAL